MNIFYYTIDDLRLPAKRPLREGRSVEQFPTLEEALARYRALPAAGIRALGLTDGVHVLELVEHRSPRPEGRDGEDVLASDYRQFPLWAQEPEAAKAAVTCTAALGLRYRVKGNVVEPIPSPEGLPRELQGKFLWLNLSGEAQSAIHQVYVAGTGWTSPGVLHRKADPMPLVLKYRADGITEQGAYLALEVEPWAYDLLALHTQKYMSERKSER